MKLLLRGIMLAALAIALSPSNASAYCDVSMVGKWVSQYDVTFNFVDQGNLTFNGQANYSSIAYAALPFTINSGQSWTIDGHVLFSFNAVGWIRYTPTGPWWFSRFHYSGELSETDCSMSATVTSSFWWAGQWSAPVAAPPSQSTRIPTALYVEYTRVYQGECINVWAENGSYVVLDYAFSYEGDGPWYDSIGQLDAGGYGALCLSPGQPLGFYQILSFWNEYNGYETGTNIEIEVVELPDISLEVNCTPGQDDDITLLGNYSQNIDICVSIQGNLGPDSVGFVVSSNGGQGTLSSGSLTGSGTVTLTPTRVSGAANDVEVTATLHGIPVVSEDLTIVTVAIGTVNGAWTHPDMTLKRIPPRVDTNISVTITPDLSLTGQVVTLEAANTSADNGVFTVGGFTTSPMNSSGLNVVRGSVNPTGDALQTKQGFADNLTILVQVRGQHILGAQSNYFSVAAIPTGIEERFDQPGSAMFGNTGLGLIVLLRFISDSGQEGDLDEVLFLEHVALPMNGETGCLVGLGTGNNNAAYDFIIPPGWDDEHTDDPTTFPCAQAGTQHLNQTHTFQDRRTGETDIPIRFSGYDIFREVFENNPGSGVFNRFRVKKTRQATTAGGFAADAGETISELGVPNAPIQSIEVIP